MKKFALCMGVVVVFVILSLSILLNTSPKEADTGLGSDPGNILSGGEVAEDEDFIYYVAGKGDKDIYKAKKDFSENKKIGTVSAGVNYLNASGDHLYFVEGSPGFVVKMSKNGGMMWPVVMKQVTNVIISGDRIYYRLTLCDGIWLKTEWLKPYVGSVYSCSMNGLDKKLISKDEIPRFVVDGDFIYYSDQNYFLWRMDTSGKNKELINSAVCSLPEFDEKYLYFTSEGRYVYRMDKETLEKEVLAEIGMEERNLHGDWIYYTKDRDGDIYRMSKDGKTNELLLESDVVSFQAAGDSLFFELYGKGFFRFDISEKKLTKLSD